MEKKPKIIVAGMCDTKFTELKFLADEVTKAGGDVKILNCSLLPSYHTVRSYYLRMYEAKFIIGAIAGAVCDNNRIGYIADYPVYGCLLYTSRCV